MHIELTEPEHDELVATRRDLHQHPEPSWKEQRTASLVADRLRGLGGGEAFADVAEVGHPGAHLDPGDLAEVGAGAAETMSRLFAIGTVVARGPCWGLS